MYSGKTKPALVSVSDSYSEDEAILISDSCYDLGFKGLSDRTTLVLSNTRELDRVSNTK